jgi:hypothetical protein
VTERPLQNVAKYKKDMKRKIITVSISVLLIVGAIFFIGTYFFSYPPDHSVMLELRDEGDIIIAKIEKYKLSHNKYPSNLADAGIILLKPRYGGWQYALENNGQSFSLAIGEYAEYLFVMVWDSTTKEWHLDT